MTENLTHVFYHKNAERNHDIYSY